MGKRYYCDFCEKAFADNPASKKNHFSASHHQRMKKEHYEAFNDPALILAAERAKKPCRKFLQTGECQYGNACRFSHLTDEKRRELEQQVHLKKEVQGSGSSGDSKPFVIGELDDWLVKRSKHLENTGTAGKRKRKSLPEFTLPSHLVGVPDLPPSLLPPTRDDFVNLPLLEWG